MLPGVLLKSGMKRGVELEMASRGLHGGASDHFLLRTMWGLEAGGPDVTVLYFAGA